MVVGHLVALAVCLLAPVDRNDADVRRFRARIAYDGKNFHGVQKNQADGAPLRTVLSQLEDSLQPALGQCVVFRAAGRTDAGASASGQVVSFDARLCASSCERT